MELADKVPVLIFALIVIAVAVYLVMSSFVVGPYARLRRAERRIVVVSLVGVAAVIVYAASELLWRVVF